MRATVSGAVQGVSFRAETVRRAAELGLLGWVRNEDDGTVRVHAEGPPAAVAALLEFLERGPGRGRRRRRRGRGGAGRGPRAVRDPRRRAGVFVVQEHRASAHHFDLRLEVGGTMRSWAVPKGPSLDPAQKRLAVEVGDHALSHNEFEGGDGEGGVIVWDRGPYEQGGRVPWPAALERGHAVFVLHGEKLRGGFALQRTGGGASRAGC